MPPIIQPGSPIEYQIQQQAIERQRALAQLLQQQAMTPTEGQMVSGHYIAPSWTQNIARLAQGLTGKSIQDELDRKQLDIANQQNKFMGDQAEQLAHATTPRAAVPGQTFTTGDPAGMGPVGTDPGTPAYNPGEREMTAAMIKYLNNIGQPAKSADYVISDAKQRMLINQLTGGSGDSAAPAAAVSGGVGGAPAAAAAAAATAAATGAVPAAPQSAFALLAPEDQNIVKSFIAAGKPEEAVKHMAEVLKPKMSSDGKMFVVRNGQTTVLPGSIGAFNSFKQAENANTLASPEMVKNSDGTFSPRTVAQVIASTNPPVAPATGTGASAPAMVAPANSRDMKVPPAQQRAADNDRIKIWQDELAAERAKPIDTRPGAYYTQTVKDQNIAALTKEISKAGGNATAAAPLTSAVAPQAAASNIIGQTTAGKQQQEEQGKFFGKTYSDTQTKAMESNQNIGRYQRLSALLDGIETGKFAGSTLEIKKAAKALGVDLGVSDTIAPLEAARALTSEMALIMRNPDSGMGMPGAMSDADRNFLVNMQPGIEQTPEGRKLMIDAAIKMEQRKQDIAKIARSYNGGNLDNGFFEEVQKYADAHPLFEGVKVPATAPKSPSAAGGKTDYEKLYGIKKK